MHLYRLKMVRPTTHITLYLVTMMVLTLVSSSVAAPIDPQPRSTTEKFLDNVSTAPIAFADVPSTKATSYGEMDSTLAQLTIAAETSVESAISIADTQAVNHRDGQIQVHISIDPERTTQVRSAVEEYGGEVTGTGFDNTLMQAWMPVEELQSASEIDGVHYIRQPETVVPLGNLQTGTSTTEGVAIINGPAWQAEGYEGQEVRIGVMDTGFTGYSDLLGTDLPASVQARSFIDDETSVESGNDPHGTACAEIIHDIAPEADLYLARVATSLDIEEAVDWFISQDVDIISSSIGTYNQTPGDGTGSLPDLVSRANQEGILWITAAGNDRENHWSGSFTDANGDGALDFDDSPVNYFVDESGEPAAIRSGFPIRVHARWSDWTNVDQDYDLFLVRWNIAEERWEILSQSTDFQDGQPGQRPTEFVAGVTAGESTFYGYVIARANEDDTKPVNFDVFTPQFLSTNLIVTQRSLSNIADAPDAVTVAALDVVAPYPQESYSSEGPTNGPGGIATGGFTKPDIAAFANVSTESYEDPKFNGTSSATPHVAGAAAIAWSANPGYTNSEIELFLRTNAVDMGTPGNDSQFGSGRLFLGEPGAEVFQRVYLPLTQR
ncbi:MAG: S8 family serine peptidase [Chloroflexota bacterium]